MEEQTDTARASAVAGTPDEPEPVSGNARKSAGLVLCLGYVAVILTAGLMFGTQLIPAWKQWYSSDQTFRQQTQALQAGHLALDHDPGSVRGQMVWTGSGVQQPGGLGVPLWRVPFEAIARVFGSEAFPDRLALGLFVALVLFWTLWIVAVPSACRNVDEWFSFLRRNPETLACVFVLALAPPFLALCRTRLFIQEETAVYAYLFSIGLFAATLQFARKPNGFLYCGLGAGAALIGFFNPPALFYGLASLLIALCHARILKWTLWKSSLGPAVFCLFGAALLLTNYLRFGSGFEFGRSFDLSPVDDLRHASRFSHPYAVEPLPSAARELFSLLFIAGDRFADGDGYKAAFFPGQSPTVRWRDLYFNTYNLWFFALLITAWGLSLWKWLRSRTSGLSGKSKEQIIMSLWSFLSLAPIALIYLRTPVVSSSRLLDFAPSLSVAVLACFWAIQPQRIANPAGSAVRSALLAAVIAWWSWQCLSIKVASPGNSAIRLDDLTSLPARRNDSHTPLPNRYVVGSFVPAGARFNALGWNRKSGETRSCATFLVDHVEMLELLVAPRTDATLKPEDFARIQAKIGTEQLVQSASEPVPGGRKLVFRPPASTFNRQGLQTLSLGFVSPGQLGAPHSQFRLLGVRWRKGPEPFELAELLKAAQREQWHLASRGRNPAIQTPAPQDQAPPPSVPLPDHILAFDSEFKEATVAEGEPRVEFTFNLTNISTRTITISSVKTSCGCTAARLPPLPWLLAPGAKGQIPVAMDVMHRTGKSTKDITINTLDGFKVLKVAANISPSMGNRERNQELAKANRQAVFKGDCAKCHAEPAKGKAGEELYVAVCGICHDAEHRATMVPDLSTLKIPTNYDYWKQMIAGGKAGTLMPAFAADQGGPLTPEQIESLAKMLDQKFSSQVKQAQGVQPPHP